MLALHKRRTLTSWFIRLPDTGMACNSKNASIVVFCLSILHFIDGNTLYTILKYETDLYIYWIALCALRPKLRTYLLTLNFLHEIVRTYQMLFRMINELT